MRVTLSAEARRDRDLYLFHLWGHNPAAAAHEARRIAAALRRFAGLPLEGIEVRIEGWPRAVREHYIRPFRVYYERRPGVLYVVRLHHHARDPIER
jgi:plasmid stabilization system protein ParE